MDNPLPSTIIMLQISCLSANIYSGRSRISQTEGANPCILGKNLLIGKIFAENCVKMKEIGARGVVGP